MCRARLLALASAALLALAACAAPATASGPGAVVEPFVVGGDRPATVQVPTGLDPATPTPLLVVLHGYGGSSADVESAFFLTSVATGRGWLAVAPEGTTDPDGLQFWNAGTPHCCNLYGSKVDDSAYLSSVIDEIGETVSVDPKRVYVFGHSNGGFMAYRMACDHADQIAAIVSLAGISIPEQLCHPSEAVNVLQIHGTADDAILYDGEDDDPSAEQMAAIWAAHDGCDPVADTSGPLLDLDRNLPGDETRQLAYTSGCDPGGSATLWTIDGGGHQPVPSEAFWDLLFGYLEQHAKP